MELEEWEHERHQKELEWQAAVMEKLKQELVSEQEKRLSGVVAPPGGSGLSSEFDLRKVPWAKALAVRLEWLA